MTSKITLKNFWNAMHSVIINVNAGQKIFRMHFSKHFPLISFRQDRGFSLIEMCVVVVIMVILAALLFPALRIARDYANLTTCTANLRGLGTLVSCYQADNDGYYMPYAKSDKTWWSEALKPYLSIPANEYVGQTPGSTKALRCPVVSAQFAAASGKVEFAARWPSYAMNQYMGPYGETAHLIKGAMVSDSARKILFGDGLYNNSNLMAGLKPSDPTSFKDYHMGGNNYLFVDGHVQLWKDSKSLTKDPYNAGSSQDMWKP